MSNVDAEPIGSKTDPTVAKRDNFEAWERTLRGRKFSITLEQSSCMRPPAQNSFSMALAPADILFKASPCIHIQTHFNAGLAKMMQGMHVST